MNLIWLYAMMVTNIVALAAIPLEVHITFFCSINNPVYCSNLLLDIIVAINSHLLQCMDHGSAQKLM